MQYEKIITHNDFDGIASAAICSYVYKIDQIQFAGPNTIARAEITVSKNDIVCDLPYPLECGLWFDHHEGNLQELKFRNLDQNSIPGKFDVQPSCARVIFEYFRSEIQLPEHFISLVEETDKIDSFNFSSIEEWRNINPAKIIEATIKSRKDSFIVKLQYLKQLTFWFRDNSISEIGNFPEIQERYNFYLSEETEILKIIERNSSHLPQDNNKEIVILDLSDFNHPPFLIKNLSYLLHPNAGSVLEIKSIFRKQVKTN